MHTLTPHENQANIYISFVHSAKHCRFVAWWFDALWERFGCCGVCCARCVLLVVQFAPCCVFMVCTYACNSQCSTRTCYKVTTRIIFFVDLIIIFQMFIILSFNASKTFWKIWEVPPTLVSTQKIQNDSLAIKNCICKQYFKNCIYISSKHGFKSWLLGVAKIFRLWLLFNVLHLLI